MTQHSNSNDRQDRIRRYGEVALPNMAASIGPIAIDIENHHTAHFTTRAEWPWAEMQAPANDLGNYLASNSEEAGHER